MLEGAIREMSPILGTSPKMTFFGSFSSRGVVWEHGGSCGVAGDRGICWEVHFGRCPQCLGHLPKLHFSALCPLRGASGGLTGHVEPQVVRGGFGELQLGRCPQFLGHLPKRHFSALCVQGGGALGGLTVRVGSHVAGGLVGRCNSGDVPNS